MYFKPMKNQEGLQPYTLEISISFFWNWEEHKLGRGTITQGFEMSKWFLVYNENVKIKFSCSNTVHKWQEKPRYCDLAGCFLKICNLRDVYLGERERVIYITLIVKISQYVAFSNYNLIKVFPYPRTTFQVLGITLTAKFYFQTFWLFFSPLLYRHMLLVPSRKYLCQDWLLSYQMLYCHCAMTDFWFLSFSS